MSYQKIHTHILKQLGNLPATLTYHTTEHVLDVLQQANEIALAEGVTSEKEVELLSIACLYHDTGFLHVYKGHEEASCENARRELPGFGYNNQEIDLVCGMIMATRIPQSPRSKLEEIICDADLDYLGRDDFYRIGQTLFNEMKYYGFLKDEQQWNRIQKAFLEQHHYFTPTNLSRRAPLKEKHLKEISRLVASYDAT